MEAGVQHVVFDLALLQAGRQFLGLLDGHGADQDRLLPFVAVLDQVEDRLELLAARAEHDVVLVLADAGHVGWNLDHLEAVDLMEFAGFGHRRAGHAGQLRIQAEIVLEGDRGQRLVLVLDLHAFLGFQGLVQAFGIAPALHHAAGEFVDDDDLAVLDDVIRVALEQDMRAQRRIGVMDQGDVVDVVERAVVEQALLAHHRFQLFHAGFGEGDGARLFVLFEVIGGDVLQQLVDGDVEVRIVLGRARDDQRRARLVDQDAVDFVDDGVVEGPLNHVVERELHVVAQIIEAQFVVGRISDVAAIGGAPFVVVQPVLDDADGEPQEIVDRPHPVRIA